ncbi:hypothetical protein LOAG_17199 [Loa loa]|uniref:Uncharacterized protein n=1 Tax=Loa loa TaxID=7209 RepID=A0A1S0ULP1_LOALO|nr:hypothetical protein LOAG_17199 [Loa loa]EJD75704.1 hypothetical protein LOAG_17199 [Loa loa]
MSPDFLNVFKAEQSSDRLAEKICSNSKADKSSGNVQADGQAVANVLALLHEFRYQLTALLWKHKCARKTSCTRERYERQQRHHNNITVPMYKVLATQ